MKTGVDIMSIDRFKKHLNNEKFLERIFTKFEVEHIIQHKTRKGQLERMAGKYCAKEAVAKALGTGIANGVCFNDIEIKEDEYKRPIVNLKGKAKIIYDSLGFNSIEISISHDNGMAVAFCVIV